MDESVIFDRYFNLSLRFISYRPRSKKEVFNYLKEKSKKAPHLDEKVIAKIMQRLVDLKFIDDLEFAKFWIRSRKKGFKILKFELIQKGISKEIIEKAVSEFDLKAKEDDLIEKLIEKKKKSLSKYPKQKAYEKLFSFLLRKGFDYDAIRKSLKEK